MARCSCACRSWTAASLWRSGWTTSLSRACWRWPSWRRARTTSCPRQYAPPRRWRWGRRCSSRRAARSPGAAASATRRGPSRWRTAARPARRSSSLGRTSTPGCCTIPTTLRSAPSRPRLAALPPPGCPSEKRPPARSAARPASATPSWRARRSGRRRARSGSCRRRSFPPAMTGATGPAAASSTTSWPACATCSTPRRPATRRRIRSAPSK
mmetsp:Transcript_31402/g.79356  ORF Transcript_31402/g.79356 Transcript_31402/m.79356 type:complete len:212 (-) Transcript_31402:607-1242(-)